MCAARVLGDFVDNVTIIERDPGISRPCAQNAPVRPHFSDLRDWLAERAGFEPAVPSE
jgi:hypothetical protein